MSQSTAQLLEDASRGIAARERQLDGDYSARSLLAASALAHARKEWGHASQSHSGDGAQVGFHLSIVERDLRAFDDLMAEAKDGLNRN